VGAHVAGSEILLPLDKSLIECVSDRATEPWDAPSTPSLQPRSGLALPLQ
jgi:hypothetical protein